MINVFIRPTPTQFYYLTIIFIVIATILSYFLAGWKLTFMGALVGVHTIALPYHLKNKDKLRDKEKTKKDWTNYFITPFITIFVIAINEGDFFREDFVYDKIQLSQTSGIIPEQGTKLVTGSGKSRRTYYYLTINGVNLHCSEDDLDDCDNIYSYKDKNAIVYYQPNTKNGNLAYEILVDNIPVYEFNNQLKSFQDKRHKENWQYIWFFILFILPSFYFSFLHRQSVDYIDEMEEHEKLEHDLQDELDTLNKGQPSKQDYGWSGFVTYWFGMLCLAFAFFTFIFSLFAKSSTIFLIFVLLSIVGGTCTYFPRRHAKGVFQERISSRQLELTNQLSQIRPQQTIADITTKPINPNRVIWEHPATNNTTNTNTDQSHLEKYYDNDNDEYYDECDEDEVESVSLADFGLLGLFILLVGATTFIINGYLIFDDSLKDYKINYLFFFIYFIGSVIMIFKTFRNAQYNRDVRVGLYDDVDLEDTEDIEDKPLLYRVFRLLSLIFLFLLFLCFSYFLIIGFMNLYFYSILSNTFFLIAVIYGMKKLW